MARRSAAHDVFGAIADPTRRRLLERLANRERSVSEMAAGTGLTTSAISLHLQVLLRAGLVSRRTAGRHRFYRLDPAPLCDVADWAAQLSAFWAHNLDRLQQLAEEKDASINRTED